MVFKKFSRAAVQPGEVSSRQIGTRKTNSRIGAATVGLSPKVIVRAFLK